MMLEAVEGEEEVMGKKRSVGITIAGFVFIMLGIGQFKFPLAFFMAYKQKNPPTKMIYTAAIAGINETERLIKEKENDLGKDKIVLLQQELGLIKQEISNYKEKYLLKKVFPLPTRFLILFSFISAILYIYTGMLILKLKSSFNPYLFCSIIVGLFVILLLFWEMFYTVSFSIHLVDKLNMLLSKINQTAVPVIHSNLDIAKTMFLQPITAVLAASQFLFISIIIYFFTRPKVKEQFK